MRWRSAGTLTADSCNTASFDTVIYLRSNTGPVMARDNIMFNQFGYGVHVFTNPGQGQLNNIRLEGNVSFNNGTLSNNSSSSNILFGGDDYSTGGVFDPDAGQATGNRGFDRHRDVGRARAIAVLEVSIDRQSGKTAQQPGIVEVLFAAHGVPAVQPAHRSGNCR